MEKMRIFDRIMIGVLIIFTIITMYNIISFFIVDEQMLLKRDWNINMPKPEDEKVIYSSFGVSDGNELQIWQYSNEMSEQIINESQLKNINKEDIEMLKTKLNGYYKLLREEDRSLFDKNIEISKLLTEENYYIISNSKNDERSWVMLILDKSKSKLYYLTTIW